MHALVTPLNTPKYASMTSPTSHGNVLLLFLWTTMLQCAICSAQLVGPKPMVERFEGWLTRNHKTYKDDAEMQLRFMIYQANVGFIDALNAIPGRTFNLTDNKFSDMTNSEFRATYLGLELPPTPPEPGPFRYQNVTAPPSVDWRQQGAMPEIKDQAQCECCWAFCTISSVESLTKIKGGKLMSLSEQQLVDCDTGNNGCHGGTLPGAFQYIIDNGGVTTEADYPYVAADGQCNADKAKNVAAKISGFEYVPGNNADALMAAVSQQPVPVPMAGGSPELSAYSGGIFDGASCDGIINHGMAVVGYGDEGGNKFWILRNSWGKGWGEGGYLRLAMASNEQTGPCGIFTQPCYPVA